MNSDPRREETMAFLNFGVGSVGIWEKLLG